MSFKQMEMLSSDNSEFRMSGKEASGKFSGSSDIILFIGSLMNSQAPEETKMVIESVKRNDFSFVSNPIRQPTKPNLQRLSI